MIENDESLYKLCRMLYPVGVKRSKIHVSDIGYVGGKAVATTEETSQDCAQPIPAKTAKQRKSEIIQKFVDKYVNVSTEITPEWQRAIDNYNRLKAMKVTVDD